MAKELSRHQPPPAIPYKASSLSRHERLLAAMYYKALYFAAYLHSPKQCLHKFKTEALKKDRRCASGGWTEMRKEPLRVVGDGDRRVTVHPNCLLAFSVQTSHDPLFGESQSQQLIVFPNGWTM